ncbi:MAG: SDR family NAD(P)-dependent oxidoreductase [Saprospiraceae bacterium]|nr:SDR family NAD(P)-dependent oxidoreductase [Saprospiraceae bacterium]
MKNAIIIGAGSGISLGVAKRFGSEGFHISLISRNEKKLQDLVATLQHSDIVADYYIADVSDKLALQNAIETSIQKNAYPDLVLYNASAIHIKDILLENWTMIQTCFDICTGGAFHTAQIILPEMLKHNSGRLFFTGGGTALKGESMFASLSIGKAGMRNLVQALVQKAKDSNVHVAQLTVCGKVDPADIKYKPETIAEEYWKLYQQEPGSYVHEVIY